MLYGVLLYNNAYRTNPFANGFDNYVAGRNIIAANITIFCYDYRVFCLFGRHLIVQVIFFVGRNG